MPVASTMEPRKPRWPSDAANSRTIPPPSVFPRGKRARPLFDPPIVRRAIIDSFVKLNPVTLMKNPVMFVVEVGASLTTLLMFRHFRRSAGIGFELQIALWLWFTVLFANFAEAMAEGRGKAQADSLRKTKTDALAKRSDENGRRRSRPRRCSPQRRRLSSASRTTSSPAMATSSKASPASMNP